MSVCENLRLVDCEYDSEELSELIAKCETKLGELKELYDDTLDPQLLTHPTFEMLCKHLIREKYDRIDEFIKKYYHTLQKHFEPQESVFRLFAILGLFDDFEIGGLSLSNHFYVSSGNFSGKRGITVRAQLSKVFKSHLKDKGDISDLTLISEQKYKLKNNKYRKHG